MPSTGTQCNWRATNLLRPLIHERVRDNPRAVSSHTLAAKVLASLMDNLRAAGMQGRGGAVVTTLTAKGSA
jgi:hypothetical protein